MSTNPTEVAVGALVLAAAIGFVAYAGQVTGFSSSTGGYPLTASFRSLEGVSVGTDVRLAGVKVGSVTDVALNPQTFRADTEITVQNGIDIPDDSAIVISSEGLLGGNYVEIVPGGSPFNFEPGAEVEDTQGAVSLVSLLMKFVSGGDE
ncbi:outer membrane lipid asymmetry maintenance protein MlaD [Thalassovita mediterranea]|jgi:phospholipid/cholesterol/gamma-HCH transport system substrate-binding protein|uniref:Putative phospholipid ABC transporter-binding protein MlaD n=1 Tax=Thalassovita mediterranea TaxID=340021 RepID=A0A0P1GNJ9_9RHOB|nr:outer membrane lipid asymmetry maintenance protein MlaD [Thalassovita mediterranea]MCG7574377.1 outer membrane lipid asymmetry maintenance protein MlaD [Phaeobacter sp. CNT1-3]CUH83783.1 putative phospholipid ABC transporter-binding protein MlaD [Thalassovita mediterranea]SIS28452.1 phospholipid/cholesterol/gamma-HCH transport system substrate-binding protein [Thalassovita mediterranea]